MHQETLNCRSLLTLSANYSDSELLAKVRQLKPVQFRYNEDIDPDCLVRGGFIAQQVQKIFPEIVREIDGLLRVNTTKLGSYINRALDEHKKDKFKKTSTGG